MDKKSWMLSKKYTDETAIQFGGLKGANAKITSVIKKDGQNIITFEWKNDDGDTRETKVYVDDGTPIYNYTAGETYKYGDLCIYSGSFYRCIHEHVAPATMIDAYWDPIGNTDGNYGLVDTATNLPSRYTSADRKVFFVEDEATFYLWNGTEWEIQIDSITDSEIDALFV